MQEKEIKYKTLPVQKKDEEEQKTLSPNVPPTKTSPISNNPQANQEKKQNTSGPSELEQLLEDKNFNSLT